MKKIGVIASLPEELAVLEKGMVVTGKVERAGLSFIEGTIGEKWVIATICGVGKVNGARTAQILIDFFALDAIVHTGVAGSLHETASYLSLVVSAELTYHDADTQWLTDIFPADEALRNALLSGAQAFGGANAGSMATGDRFFDKREVIEVIFARRGGLCVDMETGATAHVAVLNGVPYCAIKCISDMTDDSAGGTFEDFVVIAADKAAGSALRAIAEP